MYDWSKEKKIDIGVHCEINGIRYVRNDIFMELTGPRYASFDILTIHFKGIHSAEFRKDAFVPIHGDLEIDDSRNFQKDGNWILEIYLDDRTLAARIEYESHVFINGWPEDICVSLGMDTSNYKFEPNVNARRGCFGSIASLFPKNLLRKIGDSGKSFTSIRMSNPSQP